MEVRADVAAQHYDSEIQSRLATSVWTACQSWYRHRRTGRIVTNWPGKAAGVPPTVPRASTGTRWS